MNRTRTSVRDLRRGNRSAVLSRLYFNGPLSRQDLSLDTGLSQGTISNVTGDLIGEGLVVEAGVADSEGGRPPVLLRVDPGYAYVVGVDVGETRIKVELFDLAMRVRATFGHQIASGRPEPATVATASQR
jgi:hypothetical protein